ncbi:hypothetical protein D9611_014852 [Ephemerocybe angulata]|uniref:MYND-type domain-containing protein n=1 Tax=Ephemerocybe angulata TaxID=980116 RepID=A0A8H5B8J2_9AGAR|nr:hypothetical protein D9611_014852 [Tulosesus angulatus]
MSTAAGRVCAQPVDVGPLDIPSSMVPAISASDYMRFIEPTNHLLLLCTMHSGALRIAIDRINTLKKKERKDKEGGDRPTAALWTILHVYESLSSGSVVLQKNLDKTPFLSKALALVAEVTLVWPNTGKLCLAVEVVNLLFPPQSLNAFAMTHQVPGLIKAGLLDIIASGHLVPSIKWPGGNPLWRLYRLVYHPRVCDAVVSATNAMPESKLKALAANPDWNKFQDVVSDLRNVYSVAPPLNRNEVPLCDNLFHPTMSQQVILKDTKGVQCSWCHTTVYCSRECQHKDWDLFHKSECTANRVQRIGLEITNETRHSSQPRTPFVVRSETIHKGVVLQQRDPLWSSVYTLFDNYGREESNPGVQRVEAVNLVFQPHFPNALAMTHTLPRVINSGLLHVIANALLVPSIKWPDGGDPLWRLYRLLYYPRVCDAVTSAINAMPDTTLKALSSIPDWKKFYGVASDLRNVYAAAPPRNEVPLCDNLFHPTMSHQVILKDTKGVQCSWCHTTVYCSRECLTLPNSIREPPLTQSHVLTTDRQLHGGWLSHRTRALFLVLMRALLLHPGMPNIEDPLTVPWFDLRTYPHNMHQLDVEDMHNQLTDYGEDTFGDARSKAILDEFVEKGGTVRLAGFIAEFGEYHIFTLARFRRVEPGLGTAPRVWHSGLMPLGVHVRVLRRPFP